MTKMNESDFKPGDIVRWIGEWAFPLVDAPPRENTVLAIEADGKVRLEGRHGGEAPLRWWCPPDQLVRREPVQAVALEIGEAALDAPSLQAAEDNNECSACGETCHWNDDADRDDPDPLCNPCAQQIASEEVATAKAVVRDAARAHKARSEDAREYREFLRWQAEAVARSVFGIIGHTPEPLSHVVYEGGDGRTVTVIGGDPLKADANDILSRGAIEAHQMRELLSLTLGGPEVKLGAGVRELAEVRRITRERIESASFREAFVRTLSSFESQKNTSIPCASALREELKWTLTKMFASDCSAISTRLLCR